VNTNTEIWGKPCSLNFSPCNTKKRKTTEQDARNTGEYPWLTHPTALKVKLVEEGGKYRENLKK